MTEEESLDLAYEILSEHGQPMNWRKLHEEAVKRGWTSENTFPARQLYRYIKMNIRREGAASRFRKPSDGYLTTATVHPTETPLSKVKYRERMDPRREESRYQLPLLCGNCTHLRFSGIEEVNQNSGQCDNWERSQRLGVQSAEPGCIYWQQRRPSQRAMDRSIRTELLEAVMTGRRMKRK